MFFSNKFFLILVLAVFGFQAHLKSVVLDADLKKARTSLGTQSFEVALDNIASLVGRAGPADAPKVIALFESGDNNVARVMPQTNVARTQVMGLVNQMNKRFGDMYPQLNMRSSLSFYSKFAQVVAPVQSSTAKVSRSR